MTFAYPLGLLALVAIPIIILIYIIKSKYTEQTIASTYLWTLSEKFLKKRKPISKLTGIITLILQLLAVVIVALLIAQPVFTIKGAARDVYFILDGSASMNIVDGESTRFEVARENIENIIDDTPNGSRFTLILADRECGVAFEDVRDKKQAKLYVQSLNASWCASDCSDALLTAQKYYSANRSAFVYLITDRDFETDNITAVNVAEKTYNRGLSGCGVKNAQSGLVGYGKIASYFSDSEVVVELFASSEIGGELVKAGEAKVNAHAGVIEDFEINTSLSSYAVMQFKIAGDDDLSADDSVMLYDDAKAQARKALIVGDGTDGIYIKSALEAAGKTSVDVMSSKQYSSAVEGYGLYVFNGFTPASLPANAAIWLINSVSGTDNGCGITFRDVQIPRDETGANSYYLTEYTKGSSSLERTLTKDLIGRQVAVRKYSKLGVPRGFTSVMNIGTDSVVAVGLNKNGDREVVFAFSIGDSEFGLSEDFLVLVRNLTDYSFPSVLPQTAYTCGDTASVNIIPGCIGITVNTPSGRSVTLDTMGRDVCEMQLTENGTYVLSIKLKTGGDMEMYAFAAMPSSEGGAEASGVMMLSGEQENNFGDGYYDDLLAFFIVLAVLILIDWGIYCYEQHQLR